MYLKLDFSLEKLDTDKTTKNPANKNKESA